MPHLAARCDMSPALGARGVFKNQSPGGAALLMPRAEILVNRISSVVRGEDDVEEDTHVSVAHTGTAF